MRRFFTVLHCIAWHRLDTLILSFISGIAYEVWSMGIWIEHWLGLSTAVSYMSLQNWQCDQLCLFVENM